MTVPSLEAIIRRNQRIERIRIGSNPANGHVTLWHADAEVIVAEVQELRRYVAYDCQDVHNSPRPYDLDPWGAAIIRADLFTEKLADAAMDAHLGYLSHRSKRRRANR